MSTPLRIKLLVSWDNTGSMYGCFSLFKMYIEDMVKRLFRDFPGEISIGFIAHGDYCDENTSYIIKTHPFSTNIGSLVSFVKSTQAAGGGDDKECYELALRTASEFDWGTDEATRILLLVGDERPHEVGYRYGRHTNNLDWKVEAQVLARQGVRIDTVQCLNRRASNAFYNELARIGGGHHLQLDQFREITDIILGICYRAQGEDQFQNFAQEVENRGHMNRTVARNFSGLGAKTKRSAVYTASTGDLEPVPAGRFQIFPVERDMPVKEFADSNGLIFKRGYVFYEFTKSETIQEKKEVVLVDRITGDMYTGSEARNMIDLPFGMRAKLKPAKLAQYRVFVQSTSNNRKLIGGTDALYEVDETR